MEAENILNPDDDLDMFCLHFVATDCIQRNLTRFANSWNNHKVRTAYNFTPYMLWIAGKATEPPSEISDEASVTNDIFPSVNYQVSGNFESKPCFC